MAAYPVLSARTEPSSDPSDRMTEDLCAKRARSPTTATVRSSGEPQARTLDSVASAPPSRAYRGAAAAGRSANVHLCGACAGVGGALRRPVKVAVVAARRVQPSTTGKAGAFTRGVPRSGRLAVRVADAAATVRGCCSRRRGEPRSRRCSAGCTACRWEGGAAAAQQLLLASR